MLRLLAKSKLGMTTLFLVLLRSELKADRSELKSVRSRRNKVETRI